MARRMVARRATGVAAERGQANDCVGETVMSETTEGTGRASGSTATLAHEMLAASARLGTHEPRSRVPGAGRFARPIKYDESGFPIIQDRAGFTRRVRQLLRG